MDIIFSAAISSITLSLYLFKKNELKELKNTKPFPINTTNNFENTEATLDKNITYYLEGLVSPIKDSEFLTCTHSKKKAVILKVKNKYLIYNGLSKNQFHFQYIYIYIYIYIFFFFFFFFFFYLLKFFNIYIYINLLNYICIFVCIYVFFFFFF